MKMPLIKMKITSEQMKIFPQNYMNLNLSLIKQLNFFLLFFSVSLFSQQQAKMDSLVSKLEFSNDYLERIELLETLSNYYINFNVETSEKYAQKIKEEALAKKDSQGIALSYKMLGNIQMVKSNYTLAKKLYGNGLIFIENVDDEKLKAELLASIGNYFSEVKKSDSAFVYWNKANTIFEKINDFRALTILNFSFAASYYTNKNYVKALDYLKKTEYFNEKFRSSYYKMRCYDVYSKIYCLMGMLESCEKYNQKAYEIALENNFIINIISASSSLASINFSNDKRNKARKIFADTYEFTKKHPQILTNTNVQSFLITYTFFLLRDGDRELALQIYLNKIKPYYNYSVVLKNSLDLLDFFFNKQNNKKNINNKLNEIYSSSDLIHKIESLEVFCILLENNKDYVLLSEVKDSLLKYNKLLNYQKIGNYLNYTVEELGVERKEKENLQLKADNAEQALLTQKATTRNWILLLGILILGISAFFIWRRYKSEAKAKKTISQQKNEIEKQKNLVEVLQKELHHRMKNNLSFIDLFINLAKGRFSDDAYQTKLTELQNRMRSMFEVHKQLFKKEDITSVQAKKYINTLVGNVQKAYNKKNITITNDTHDNEKLLSSTSFPVGLIINEFITNTYKYAFDKNENGSINISLTSDDSKYLLTLQDNGKGLPKDFTIEDLDSFGMEIIQLLTKEYGGELILNGEGGVSMNIQLPKIAA